MLKDLRLNRRGLLIFGSFYPLYMGFFGSRLSTPTIAAILGAFLYGIVPIIIFGREDRFKASGFGLSLPTTRREVIRSRYLLSWILMAVCYLAASVLMVVMPGGKLGLSNVFAVRTILISLTSMTLLFSTLMPLFVWLGMAGLMAFLVAIQVLGIVFMLLRFVVGRSVIAVVRALPRAITAAVDALGPAGAAAAVVALLVLINVISLAVSTRIFAKKEF